MRKILVFIILCFGCSKNDKSSSIDQNSGMVVDKNIISYGNDNDYKIIKINNDKDFHYEKIIIGKSHHYILIINNGQGSWSEHVSKEEYDIYKVGDTWRKK